MALVLITGATSFTGCYIARAFLEAGFEVCATLTRPRSAYQEDELVGRRMAHAGQCVHWIECMRFGSRAFVDLIRAKSPAIVVSHGAQIKGYRDPGFDYLSSVRESLEGAEAVVKAAVESGCERFLYSGSIFEPGEGAALSDSVPSPAVSIYGVSKGMVWEPIRHFCEKHGLPVSKVVIPNPIGPFENPDRLIPFFVRTWRSGGVPTATTPALVRDNIPASWLARVYVEEAEASGTVRIRRPSAFAMKNRDFLDLFLARTQSLHLGRWTYRTEERASREPLSRINSEPVSEMSDPRAQNEFWTQWTATL